ATPILPDCRLQIADCRLKAKRFFPSAICNLKSAILIILAFLQFPELALASDTFPRGSGFYFDIVKIIFLLLFSFACVRTASWVDADAQDLNLPTDMWNGLLFAGGALRLAAAWMMVELWMSLIALLLLV